MLVLFFSANHCNSSFNDMQSFGQPSVVAIFSQSGANFNANIYFFHNSFTDYKQSCRNVLDVARNGQII